MAGPLARLYSLASAAALRDRLASGAVTRGEGQDGHWKRLHAGFAAGALQDMKWADLMRFLF